MPGPPLLQPTLTTTSSSHSSTAFYSAMRNLLQGVFSSGCKIAIELVDIGARELVDIKRDNEKLSSVPVFQNHEDVKGKVKITPLPGKKIEHQGIKIELIGQIEVIYDRKRFYEFTSLVRELDVLGVLAAAMAYQFEFSCVEMVHDSYIGMNFRLRYMLKVMIIRNFGQTIIEYKDIWVRNYLPLPEINTSLKMAVGIQECIQLEYEYNKSKYHLKDVIIGKICFLLVLIKVKRMELELRRREYAGSGSCAFNQFETVAKYEIMEGAPVRGESIPIRMFLGAFELTPTYTNVNNKFSVKYFLTLVLIDEEGRRYFKQQEVILYRAQLN